MLQVKFPRYCLKKPGHMNATILPRNINSDDGFLYLLLYKWGHIFIDFSGFLFVLNLVGDYFN